MRDLVRGLVLASLALLLVACGGGGADPSELTGTRVDPGFDPAPIALTAADGSDYSLTADTDKPLTLVFFGYSNCPDVCGQVMATMAGAMARLDDADRDKVDVVFITTDPARDTPEVADHYATRFDPSFIGLSGDLDDIVTVARSMAIAIDAGEKLPSGGYEVTHGTQVMAIDSDDQVPVYWSESVSQAQLANDLHLLLAEG